MTIVGREVAKHEGPDALAQELDEGIADLAVLTRIEEVLAKDAGMLKPLVGFTGERTPRPGPVMISSLV